MISIILPVYNVEAYLRRCVESLLAQTFTDFELLLVDDGSTDDSGKICDEYAKKDSRVRVFHKENGGVASARQLGVDKAKGEYSIHADGDDWVEPGMLQKMYEAIKKEDADLLIADFFVDRDGKSYYADETRPSDNSIDVLTDILTNKLFGSLWNKLIRHSLYKQYNVRFIEKIDYCEDVLILVQMLQHNIKVRFLNEAFYHYDQSNQNSISRNFTAKSYQVRKRFLAALEKLLPASFHDVITNAALEVKAQAFMYGVLPKKDFYHYMPAGLNMILHKNLNRKTKICFVIAHFGFFGLARFLFKLSVRITGRM